MKDQCIMSKYCDLHTHSVYSDGTWTPTQIINEAEKIGLSAVALTDHNEINGLTEFFNAAEGKKLEAIGGVELSTDYGPFELHIVGLFVQEKHFKKIESFVDELRWREVESNRMIISALQCAGYKVDYDEIKEKYPQVHINRAHISTSLFEKGYTQSPSEALRTLLSKSGQFYVDAKRLDVFKSIQFLKEIGCVTVLAHPFQELTEEDLCPFLKRAKSFGLDAMETEYAKYNDETINLAKKIAKKYNLKESGGSDFHGERRKDVYLGVGKGNLRIPIAFVEELRNNL